MKHDLIAVGGASVLALLSGGMLVHSEQQLHALNDDGDKDNKALTPEQAAKSLAGNVMVRTVQPSAANMTVGVLALVGGIAGLAYLGFRVYHNGKAQE